MRPAKLAGPINRFWCELIRAFGPNKAYALHTRVLDLYDMIGHSNFQRFVYWVRRSAVSSDEATINAIAADCGLIAGPTPTPKPPDTPTPAPTPTATQFPCRSDCDRTGGTTINEIVALVAILLGEQPVMSCAAQEFGAGYVPTIGDLQWGIRSLLDGCISGQQPRAPLGAAMFAPAGPLVSSRGFTTRTTAVRPGTTGELVISLLGSEFTSGMSLDLTTHPSTPLGACRLDKRLGRGGACAPGYGTHTSRYRAVASSTTRMLTWDDARAATIDDGPVFRCEVPVPAGTPYGWYPTQLGQLAAVDDYGTMWPTDAQNAPIVVTNCPQTPDTSCRVSEPGVYGHHGQLRLVDNASDSLDTFEFEFAVPGTEAGRVSFGDPYWSTNTAICVYVQYEEGSYTLVLSADMPANSCPSCWTIGGTWPSTVRRDYHDGDKRWGGVYDLELRRSSSGATIDGVARGIWVAMPRLPFIPFFGATVELVNTRYGDCYRANVTPAQIREHTAAEFRAIY